MRGRRLAPALTARGPASGSCRTESTRLCPPITGASKLVRYNPIALAMHSAHEGSDDTLLLNRLAAGDHRALGDLYDRHNRLLFGVIVRSLNDEGEAEEVLQEVFIQAWTHAHTYDGALGFAVGWLLGIARNRAIDRLRTRGSRQRAVEGTLSPPPVPTPELLASLTERQQNVHRALDALPADQRELIERAYFRGSTQSEMAAQLDLPLGTVKTRIRNGLQALRALLDGRAMEQ